MPHTQSTESIHDHLPTQANGQVERYNRTILAALCQYLADNPRDGDLYTRALTYAYNCQPHRSLAIEPFELTLPG